MLCRILTELKLLSTPVGIIVLSAGVSNDVVGWILLALCVALVNAGSGLTALWVLLCTVGFSLFLAFAVRPVFLWVLRRTRALQDGPSQGVVALTLLIALASAFFTGVIGVHPIFGAFMAGLICPHEGGFAIKVTEKIEDLVSALLLPLYFALSGLSTNIGLLDNGITWAYVIAIIAVAFVAKFVGGTLGAKLNGLVWRESFTIGALMSCKGLVELIVLNIGLQAKILSTRTFTMFVVMALVTTFATTPLTSALYPPWYQRKLEAWKRGEIDWETGKPTRDSFEGGLTKEKLETAKAKNLLVYLRLDTMPPLLAFISLFGTKSTDIVSKEHPSHQVASPVDDQPAPVNSRGMQVHALRLLELTERGSTVMKVSEIDEYSFFDPVLNAFRVLGQLFNIGVSGEAIVVPESSFPETLVNRASEESTDLLLLPWSETGSLGEAQTISNDSVKNKLASDAYSGFIAQTLNTAPCNAAVFVNKGFSGSVKQRPALFRSASGISLRTSIRENVLATPQLNRSHHIFMPFFGISVDDHVALRLVLQLAENPEVTATIVYFEPANADDKAITREVVTPKIAGDHTVAKLGSSTSASELPEDHTTFFNTLQRSLPEELAKRVVFETVSTKDQLGDALAQAQAEVAQDPKNGGDIIVVGRHTQHFKHATSANNCLGAAAQTFADSGIRASLLIVQARGHILE